MQTGREPSMEDILASIKKVIAEEKELRTTVQSTGEPQEEAPLPEVGDEDDVLDLTETLMPEIDLGPPLLDQSVAESSRHSLESLSTIAATVPAAPLVNPLEEMIREMLRPILKQWSTNISPRWSRACEARDHADYRPALRRTVDAAPQRG